MHEEKPRPSLDDTLRNIDALLEQPTMPPTIERPATGPWITETTNPGPRSVIEALLTEHVAPDGHEIVFTEPGNAPRFDATPGSCVHCRRANGVTTHCQIPAEPGTDLCRFHQPDPPAAVPGHRRSCQHDGPPGPTCPGCAEIDELLAIAHTNAAPFPPATEHRHLPGAPGPTCPGCAADAARPGWLARVLHRLFG